MKAYVPEQIALFPAGTHVGTEIRVV